MTIDQMIVLLQRAKEQGAEHVMMDKTGYVQDVRRESFQVIQEDEYGKFIAIY